MIIITNTEKIICLLSHSNKAVNATFKVHFHVNLQIESSDDTVTALFNHWYSPYLRGIEYDKHDGALLINGRENRRISINSIKNIILKRKIRVSVYRSG